MCVTVRAVQTLRVNASQAAAPFHACFAPEADNMAGAL